jgi:glycosyltransferase involved in cell wall biosynthesis
LKLFARTLLKKNMADMRIGIDLFSLDRPGGNFGVGRGVYAWNLLPQLFLLGREHRFVVFVNRENRSLVPRAENVEVICSLLPNRIRPLRILHEQIGLFFSFWRRRLDLLHLLGNDTCILLGKRTLLTVYDLMWKYYLDADQKSLKNRYFSFSVPLSLKRTGAIITISRFIARQTEDVFPFTRGKIFPVVLACPTEKKIAPDSNAAFEKKYPFPFIFSVTTSLPHKNLPLLLQAFHMLKKSGLFPGKLIVCGQLKGDFHWRTIDFIAHHNLQNEVLLSGFISDEEKQFLFKRSTLFVFPSLYEGFGLPILEAMRAGTPVVAARAASLPEVGGEACIYFDPFSADGLQAAMAGALSDENLRGRLIAKGRERVNELSWATTAKLTLDVYKKLLSSHRQSKDGK